MNELMVQFDIFSLVKWIYVVMFAGYFMFTIIVWRQIVLMLRTLNGTAIAWPLKLLGTGLGIAGAVGLVLSLLVL